MSGHHGFNGSCDPCESNCSYSNGLRVDQSPVVRIADCFQDPERLRGLAQYIFQFQEQGIKNTTADLATYTLQHQLDGFLVEGRIYMRKSSMEYQKYSRTANLRLANR